MSITHREYQATCEHCTWTSSRDGAGRHAKDSAHRVRVTTVITQVHDGTDMEQLRSLSQTLDDAGIAPGVGGLLIRRELRALGVPVSNGMIATLVRMRKTGVIPCSRR